LSKTLLLISSRPEDQAFAAEIAAVAELTLKHVTSPIEGVDSIARDEATVILADASSQVIYQKLETAIQDSVGLFSDKVNPNMIHFLSSDGLENVPYLIQSPLFGHFVVRNTSNPKEAGQLYGRIIKATLAERCFGLSKILKPGAKVQVIKLSISSQKQNAVEAIKGYLIAAKFQTRIATVVANAVDELLMNAMFDAPTDELGKHIYTTTPRSTVLKLEGKSSVEMHVGFDGSYIAISAVDQFGSLDKAKLLAHISKIYATEEYKFKTSGAGAGIGLATVFRSGGSFFFISESRTQTEVIVIFKRAENFREFKDQFKFISTQFYF
jgi:hypothetical protein